MTLPIDLSEVLRLNFYQFCSPFSSSRKVLCLTGLLCLNSTCAYRLLTICDSYLHGTEILCYTVRYQHSCIVCSN